MLTTICILKREPRIDAHHGQTCWVDIDDLHLQLSPSHWTKLIETMQKAIANPDRTVTAM